MLDVFVEIVTDLFQPLMFCGFLYLFMEKPDNRKRNVICFLLFSTVMFGILLYSSLVEYYMIINDLMFLAVLEIYSLLCLRGNIFSRIFMPLIAYNMDQSIQLLSDAIHSFNEHCLSGLKANQTEMGKNLHNSLMLVTCLNPVIGYEKAGKASQYAYKNDLTLKQAILELGYLSEEEFDLYVDPKKMINE